jgi:uncharacterized membrane protein
MDYYFWLKAAHLIAVFIVIAGLILNGFLLRYLSPDMTHAESLIAAARQWNGALVGPALLAVWALGLLLAYLGSWYADVWLMIKLLLVFILSGLHGAQTAQYRLIGQSAGHVVPPLLRHSATITLVFVALIVVLVTVKPV